ncbi:hypothetical protein MAR_031889 [Mya arenaria]|uniref:Uncharacterized protein n=1 Tax=Mya arenaria TaxID=6604 RepID=A0ABY7F562_MYAAR|nr:hypothetical protein MAR_031889 [Mya arenaria]
MASAPASRRSTNKADGQIKTLKIQKLRNQQHKAETFANEEITKLEDAIEVKKKSLILAETFAEREISTLEAKIERKESTLNLVQRFADAEITRLELEDKEEPQFSDDNRTQSFFSLQSMEEIQDRYRFLEENNKNLREEIEKLKSHRHDLDCKQTPKKVNFLKKLAYVIKSS